MISTDQAEKEEGGEAASRRDSQTPLDLLPGVRERLSQRLDCVGIPQRGRLTYVAALTCRAVQTVSRWFEAERPGLPDVESLARLCDGLGCSSDWVLGLMPEMVGAPSLMHASAAELQWVSEVASGAPRVRVDADGR